LNSGFIHLKKRADINKLVGMGNHYLLLGATPKASHSNLTRLQINYIDLLG